MINYNLQIKKENNQITEIKKYDVKGNNIYTKNRRMEWRYIYNKNNKKIYIKTNTGYKEYYYWKNKIIHYSKYGNSDILTTTHIYNNRNKIVLSDSFIYIYNKYNEKIYEKNSNEELYFNNKYIKNISFTQCSDDYYSITKYNRNGIFIYSKFADTIEMLKKYNKQGKLTHYRTSNRSKNRFIYNKDGNEVYFKNYRNNSETITEYDDNQLIIKEIEKSSDNIIVEEIIYEYYLDTNNELFNYYNNLLEEQRITEERIW